VIELNIKGNLKIIFDCFLLLQISLPHLVYMMQNATTPIAREAFFPEFNLDN
jgi:hypothetical protein